MPASVPLMVEYEPVLTRQEHLAASGLTIGPPCFVPTKSEVEFTFSL